jgi:S1/P1 Nuclease
LHDSIMKCPTQKTGTCKLYAFVHAATWADDIKTKEYGYTRGNVDSPTAGQNIGYAEHNQHAFWHFKDVNFSPDSTPLPMDDPVDLVTQLKKISATLPTSSGASDDVRSYDLVWCLQMGDAHQALHAVGRFTRAIANGDAGGNAENVIPASGKIISLHAYWDRMFGGYSSPPPTAPSSTPRTKRASAGSRRTAPWPKSPTLRRGLKRAPS